jgi:hypothetical protein
MHLIETHKWLLGAEPPTSTEDTHDCHFVDVRIMICSQIVHCGEFFSFFTPELCNNFQALL